MEKKTSNTIPAAPAVPPISFSELVSRAQDAASEAIFVPKADVRGTFYRFAKATLVLLDKSANGEFTRSADLEAALCKLAATRHEPSEPVVNAPVATVHQGPSRILRWFGNWVPGLMRTSTPATTTEPELRRNLNHSRLREIRHQDFINDRLELVMGEFDLQFHRAQAAAHLAKLTMQTSDPEQTESKQVDPKPNGATYDETDVVQ